jgi:hypothetical protein
MERADLSEGLPEDVLERADQDAPIKAYFDFDALDQGLVPVELSQIAHVDPVRVEHPRQTLRISEIVASGLRL